MKPEEDITRKLQTHIPQNTDVNFFLNFSNVNTAIYKNVNTSLSNGVYTKNARLDEY